jgi:hypothetical protein
MKLADFSCVASNPRPFNPFPSHQSINTHQPPPPTPMRRINCENHFDSSSKASTLKKMYPKILFAMVLAWLDGSALSFRSLSAVRVPRRADASPRWMQPEPETGFPHQADATLDFSNGEDKVLTSQLTSLAPACVALLAASPAEAADAVPTALWAYGHYAAMLAGMGSVVAQRFVLKNDMTKQEESLLGTLNIVYSLSLVLLLASGYFRLTEVCPWSVAVRRAACLPFLLLA